METSPTVNGTLAITTLHNNFHQRSFFLFVSSGGTCPVSSIYHIFVLVYSDVGVLCIVFLLIVVMM